MVVSTVEAVVTIFGAELPIISPLKTPPSREALLVRHIDQGAPLGLHPHLTAKGKV